MTRPSTEWTETTKGILRGATADWLALDHGDLPGKRRIVARLILDITAGLREMGVEDGDLRPLQALAAALTDLSLGVNNKLLEVAKRGRPVTSAAVRLERLYAVSLVEWLLGRGSKRRDAFQLVAREFARAGHTAHNGSKIVPDTVRKWRELAFQGGERRNDQAVIEDNVKQWNDRARLSGAQAVSDVDFVRYVAINIKKSALNP